MAALKLDFRGGADSDKNTSDWMRLFGVPGRIALFLHECNIKVINTSEVLDARCLMLDARFHHTDSRCCIASRTSREEQAIIQLASWGTT